MPPSRRSAATNKSKKGKNDTSTSQQSSSLSASEDQPFLLLEDVTCKICLNVMIRPVSLPCKHDLCYACYENCVEKANLSCPMCRKRISVWCRQAAKNKSVVNESLWAKIQAQFPELVKSQNDGTEEKDSEDCEYLGKLI